MTATHGFELIRERDIKELNTRARIYRHAKTGAQLLSLVNDDENKVFGITFRTPVSDSTGVPHILEHSVLCGSRKYPVKEPFVELLKGSLKTFLNAFTYPDKTCYPVASQNVQDFYNLVDVYLDAVFHPRLTPFLLQQEGWHYELEDPDALLAYKGVVYNEMKGSYSSPERILAEYSQQCLFPDTTYSFDSGGEPSHIPELTFSRFEAFHRAYYHPSNARIYFYGNDNPEERLRLVNVYLEEFERREVDSSIALQQPFERPKRVIRRYAAGKDEGAKPKGMVTLNWLLTETTEAETNLALHILQYILLGMPGSPLRKALIDSGLGEDLAGSGMESEMRQIFFSTGLKGIDVNDADRIEALIVETLERLVGEGIDPRTVEAAINITEFRLRENNAGSTPRGLVLMLRSLTTWLYEGDPLALLAFDDLLSAVKSSAASDKGYFEGLIEGFLLNNPHRVTLILEPDTELAEREAAREREHLARVREAMSPTELRSVIETTRELKRRQETPDSPEALATIPTLRIEDLARRNKTIPLALMEHDETKVLHHDIVTNGIIYFDVGFDLHTLPQQYVQYIPLFGRALTEMGTHREDYVALTQRISRKTGGIYPIQFTSALKDSGSNAAWLFLRGKAMVPQAQELLDILQEVLLTVRLDNRDRFRQMVFEEKARQEQRLVPGGHQIVDLRLRSHFNGADWAAEQMSGVSYLFFLRHLARMVEEDWPGVLRSLEGIQRTLINRSAMVLNVTVDAPTWSDVEPRLTSFLNGFPAQSVRAGQWSGDRLPDMEGLTMPVQVNYVGKGANLYSLGYDFHGSALVITRYIRTSWLWDKIRVQGGAYGAFCHFNRFSGVLTFVSYRDPNLLETLQVFDQTADFLTGAEPTDDEITKSIIGAIGDIDSYMLPDARGYTSMVRLLTRDTEEARQRMREEVLGTTRAHFRRFADLLGEVKDGGLVKILGSQGAIQDAAGHGLEKVSMVKVL